VQKILNFLLNRHGNEKAHQLGNLGQCRKYLKQLMDKSRNDTSTTGTPINPNSLLQSSLCFFVIWKKGTKKSKYMLGSWNHFRTWTKLKKAE
jgi:hypothetical protein